MFCEHLKSQGAIWEPFGGSNFLRASKTRTAPKEYAFFVLTKILKCTGVGLQKCISPARGVLS